MVVAKPEPEPARDDPLAMLRAFKEKQQAAAAATTEEPLSPTPMQRQMQVSTQAILTMI